jgi:hypothetical protein
MKRLLSALMIGGALAAAGCGMAGDDACVVNSYGNKLCGVDALAHCDTIGAWGRESGMTKDACKSVRREVMGDDYSDALDGLNGE